MICFTEVIHFIIVDIVGSHRMTTKATVLALYFLYIMKVWLPRSFLFQILTCPFHLDLKNDTFQGKFFPNPLFICFDITDIPWQLEKTITKVHGNLRN